jgi:hypothetical protein
MARRIALALGSLLSLPGLALAHPGHGADPSGSSLLHVLAEPEHALPLLGIACLGALVWRLVALARRAS